MGEIPPLIPEVLISREASVEGHREKGAICEQPGSEGKADAEIKPRRTPDHASATPAWQEWLFSGTLSTFLRVRYVSQLSARCVVTLQRKPQESRNGLTS